ncbi:FAD/FMN-containing dehydrogenase [Zopfia rhizophila CBS 207.26]|uniref:FAD/FMN-containing dehydrogenase n=1 Tax=Zopfia rhizophila CBS 207.26 TaxID=1314779 RepID=A0A6A6EBM6_9PEZI|nr:FAD/FMN-containing dehydrogenase [Zopfia rhizophila CBS 207.26]
MRASTRKIALRLSRISAVASLCLALSTNKVDASATIARNTYLNNTACRFLPGDSGWPSSEEWQQLNTSVDGRLIGTVPVGAVCHDPTYDGAACELLKQTWSLPQAHFNDPSAFMAAYQQNASCDPYTSRPSPCLRGNYVSYAINVTSAADVAAGVTFAQEKNVRLVIKNTGHDYLGKSTGKGGLSLWTHHLKSIEFLNYSSEAYSGPAIKIGAGVQAFEAYEAAAAAGFKVVGGECVTVGVAGGFTQGGGHSMLSSVYGMGADQALEWEVVTANGTLVIATPTANEDLYWALSGGGGGTYGVVLSLTVKAYPDGVIGGASMWAIFGSIFSIGELTLPGATKDEVRTLLAPFTSYLAERNISYQLNVTSLPSFLEHIDRYVGPLPYGTIPSAQIQGGTMVSRTVVEKNNAEIMAVLRNISTSSQFYVAAYALNVSKQPSSPNALLPSWRDALIYYVIPQFWNYTIPFEEMAEQEDFLSERVMPPLQAWGSGAYMNEADFQDPGWKQNFYGENYARLKRVKRTWDPKDLFYATTAVGSEAWEVMGDGRLCRA